MPNNSLNVTPICIDTSGLASMPGTFGYEVSEERAVETIRAAFHSSINFMDTAAGYGDGESERRIGLVLSELGGLPEGYVLATKIDPDKKTRDFSGAQAQRSLERCMKLLGLDYLPIVHLHDPEVSTFENLMQPGGAV